MQISDILISPVEQGMLCPREDGTMDLYLVRSLNKLILSCPECEATCDAPIDVQPDQPVTLTATDLFPEILGAHTQLFGCAQRFGISESQLHHEMERILNHRMFAVGREEFAELILDVWRQRKAHQLLTYWPNSAHRESIIDLGRPIGHKGETAVYLIYDDEPEAIHDAFPVFREGGS